MQPVVLPLDAEVTEADVAKARSVAPVQAWCVLDDFVVEPLPATADELLHRACWD